MRTKIIEKRAFRSVLVFAFLFAFAGCEAVLKDLLDHMAKAECKPEADVNSNRSLLLFARNHVYVGGDGNKYDPSFLSQGIMGLKWKNDWMVKYREKQIEDCFHEANRIFSVNQLNIQVYAEYIPEIIVDSGMIPADCGGWGCQGHVLDVEEKMRTLQPQYIHVHWTWQNKQAPVAVGMHFSVVVCDDPQYGSAMSGNTLAHELIHAFGYTQHTQVPGNLMADTGVVRGDVLTNEQKLAVWQFVKNNGKQLAAFSCLNK